MFWHEFLQYAATVSLLFSTLNAVYFQVDRPLQFTAALIIFLYVPVVQLVGLVNEPKLMTLNPLALKNNEAANLVVPFV